MENYFILTLGIILFVLHVPGLIIPTKHRELGRRFAQKKSNIRLIGLVIVTIGAIALLVSPQTGFTKWFLLVFGIIESVAGLFLLLYPGKFTAKIDRLFSSSLRVWIGRAVTKCVVAISLIVWGVFLILK